MSATRRVRSLPDRPACGRSRASTRATCERRPIQQRERRPRRARRTVGDRHRASLPYDPRPHEPAVQGPPHIACRRSRSRRSRCRLRDGEDQRPHVRSRLYRGAVLFSQRCSGCHTLSYAATHGSAANVRTREVDNGPNFNVRCERPVTRVLYAIENGGFSGAIMPQNVVVGQQAREVAEFVAKYAGRQAPKLVRHARRASSSRSGRSRRWPDRHRDDGDAATAATRRPPRPPPTAAKTEGQGAQDRGREEAQEVMAPQLGQARSRHQADPPRPGRRPRGARPPRPRGGGGGRPRARARRALARAHRRARGAAAEQNRPAAGRKGAPTPEEREQLAALAARGRALSDEETAVRAERDAALAALPNLPAPDAPDAGHGAARGRRGRRHRADHLELAGPADRHGARAPGCPARASPTCAATS